MVNFKAKKMQSAYILQRKHNGDFCKRKAYIAKLDVKSKEDLLTLDRLNDKWEEQYLLEDILGNFVELRNNRSSSIKEDYFVLTTQFKNFDTLDENRILGITQVNKIDNLFNDIKIENLQTNPNTKHGVKLRNYQYVGAELIKFIKNYYNEKEIYLFSDRFAIPFYKKQGFKQISDSIKMVFSR